MVGSAVVTFGKAGENGTHFIISTSTPCRIQATQRFKFLYNSRGSITLSIYSKSNPVH